MNLDAVRLKQELYSIAQAAAGFFIVFLVLTGIGVTLYKIVSPNGWIVAAFGRSVSAGAAALGSLVMVVGLAWFSRGWSDERGRNRVADLLVYAFAAAGLFYFARLCTVGSF